MISGSDPRVSSRIWLCAIVAALGLVAVSMHFPLRVHAQTAQAQTAQAQTPHPRPRREELPADSVAKVGTLDSVATVHVDVTPEHVLNTIYPDTATGAWMDDLSKAQVDNLSKPEVIQGVKNLGWGSITMRNNSELRLAAWHWNENGTWSDPATKSGYYVGSADLGEPIHYGYSYSLPHRDFMTSGDSPLVAGFQSYWKSNPYLTSHFTGESDTLHPQWVVIDMGTARARQCDPYSMGKSVCRGLCGAVLGRRQQRDGLGHGPERHVESVLIGRGAERQRRGCPFEAFG